MELLAIFSPLAGFLAAGLLGGHMGSRGAQFIACLCVIISTLASAVIFFDVTLMERSRVIELCEWISSGDLSVSWSLRFDTISVVMMSLVTFVSACVHIYSIGYMKDDPGKSRFFAYLNLFTFAMLMLVSSDNLLQMFFGWEGVGLTSYLLIGFWNKKDSANSAAIKAFLVNRIGDAGFLLGIFVIFVTFGELSFQDIFAAVPEADTGTLNVIGLLLFVGAMGKSAQLGLHTWLPDAMEGPTPVSALIHAATMVTAGVFMIARFSPLYEYAPLALTVICVAGAITALFGATVACVQNDIKRVIAYSTISQLGYMFMALGVSAYGAAMFHLVTHAFFKALLFLGAGAVIHSLSGEQDMRKMGGVWKMLPSTYVLMWVGALALSGLPFFAGFYSKDMILEAVWADGTWFGSLAFGCGVAAALMTAFYCWRMLFMTFHGDQRADEKVMAHIHEVPKTMHMPMTFLAMGAIFAGSYFYGGFVGEPKYEPFIRDGIEYVSVWNRHFFWGESILVLEQNDTIEAAHHISIWGKYVPLVAAVFGILLAYIGYGTGKKILTEDADKRASSFFYPVYAFVSNKWYFDELYRAALVRPVLAAARFLANVFDPRVIDRFGPDGVSYVAQKTGGLLSRFQSGFVYHYAFVMIAGVVLLVSWFFFMSG